jgi:hypothetical protein
MQSRSEAIVLLAARGFHAQAWDHFAEGALAVASSAVDAGGGVRILKQMVVVVPLGEGWAVHCGPPGAVKFPSLGQAVEAAVVLVRLLGGCPMPPTMKELGIDQLSVADHLALMEEIWRL